MRADAGFTMVELIVTMIIVGIMAVAVAPRFDLLGGFDARGVGDQAASYLRFAQKTALAQRRYVSVSGLTTTAAAPTIQIWPNADCSSGSATALSYPGQFTAPRSAVTASGTDTFCFDTLGGVSATADVGFSGDGTSRTIRVEAVTGFIHGL